MLHKDDTFVRVQVKVATWIKAGRHRYLQCRTRLTKKYQSIQPADLYDLLVVVAPDGRLWAIPAPAIKSSNLCIDGTGPKNAQRSSWFKYQILGDP